MANIVISGDSSGSVTLSAPAVSGTTVLTLPTTSGTLIVSGGAQTIEFADGTVSAPSITNSGDTNTGIYFPAADTIAFTEGGVESMRIDSSGQVGIGTSSPSRQLSVYSSSVIPMRVESTTADSQIELKNSGGTALVASSSGNYLVITNAAERMRIDSSGNVGIGTSSPNARLEALSSTAGAEVSRFEGNYAASGSVVLTNWRRNGGAVASAMRYNDANNAMEFGSTTSHAQVFMTAGTERMRLDTNGNLGIGGLASGYGASRLAVVGGELGLSNTSDARFYLYTGATVRGLLYADATRIQLEASGTNPLTLWTNSGERARIDSNGNFIIGATASNSKLLVNDQNNRTEATSQLRVVGSGYALYGWLDATAAYIGQDSNSRDLRMYAGSTPTTGVKLTPGATSWVSTSDENLKDIIEPITNAAEKVSTLRAVIGKYKNDEIGTRRSFLIAQDVEKVLPEAVHIGSDESLNLGYTEVIPLLVAAIKEQQAIITQLQADVAALKGAK